MLLSRLVSRNGLTVALLSRSILLASANKRPIMTTAANNPDNKDPSIWNGSDKSAFDDTNHPGYTVHSDPGTFVGGWQAHRETTSSTDWIQEEVADYITKFDYEAMPIGRPPRILVLYGSLRPTSFSRKLAYEFARLLDLVLGCDVRVYNPRCVLSRCILFALLSY